jgi:hypothetical protein
MVITPEQATKAETSIVSGNIDYAQAATLLVEWYHQCELDPDFAKQRLCKRFAAVPAERRGADWQRWYERIAQLVDDKWHGDKRHNGSSIDFNNNKGQAMFDSTLDEMVKPQRAKKPQSTASAATSGSPSKSPLKAFRRKLRANKGLNAVGRGFWLMTELSGRFGFTMSTRTMAEELGVDIDKARAIRRKVVDPNLGLFEHEAGKYRRLKVGQQKKSDFDWRVLQCPAVNLAVRVAWALCLLYSWEKGYAEISFDKLAERLGTTERKVRFAVNKLIALGLFRVERGDGRGHVSRFYPDAVTPTSNDNGEGLIIDNETGNVVTPEPTKQSSLFNKVFRS